MATDWVVDDGDGNDDDDEVFASGRASGNLPGSLWVPSGNPVLHQQTNELPLYTREGGFLGTSHAYKHSCIHYGIFDWSELGAN